jgi:CDP-diacylglycerol---glycerol-3-phosphate 3-phosphatidyltransferase
MNFTQVETLRSALASNESLILDLHLDLNRSTRPGYNSPVNLLLSLLHLHPERVRVHLFRSPALRGLMAKLVPPRFNEGWGTWHAKIYGVDDDIMISG